MKIKREDLWKYARWLKHNKGKVVGIVYTKETDLIRKLHYDNKEQPIHFIHYTELDEIDKDAVKLFTLESYKVPGYDIEELEFEYKTYLTHITLSDSGILHIGKFNDNGDYTLCGKNIEKATFSKLEPYTELNKPIYKYCKKCEEQYQFYKHIYED